MIDQPPRHVLIILNPAAGRRRRPFFEAVLRELRALGVAATVRETTAPGHAETLAREAMREGFDVIVAAGGDGTINEVVNGIHCGLRIADCGLAGAENPQPRPALAIVPLGTANVMAAEIGLAAAPEGVARAIAHGTPRPVYFARASGRVFTLMAGAGIDARIVSGVDLALKRRVGKLAYAWQTWLELVHCPPTTYEVTIDGETHRAAWVVVANGRYYGGRFICAPEARLEEPVLHVCLFQRPGRFHAVRYAWGLVCGGLCRMGEMDYRIIRARSLRIGKTEAAMAGVVNAMTAGMMEAASGVKAGGVKGEGAAKGEGAGKDEGEERMQLDGDVGVPLPAEIEVIEKPFYLVGGAG